MDRGGWVGPRVGLDDVKKRKFLTIPGFEPRRLVQPVASRYIDCAIPAPSITEEYIKVLTTMRLIYVEKL
jgi:hypothetical protein